MSSFSKQGDEIFFTLLNSGGDHVEEGERKIYIPDGSCYKFTCKADLNSDLTVANLKEKLKLELGGGCIYSLFAINGITNSLLAFMLHDYYKTKCHICPGGPNHSL